MPKIDVNRLVRRLQVVEEAERECRPILGDQVLAFDRAPDIYRAALTAMGIDIEGVHPSGYGPIYRAHRRIGRGRRISAEDEAAVAERFPDIARIQRL